MEIKKFVIYFTAALILILLIMWFFQDPLGKSSIIDLAKAVAPVVIAVLGIIGTNVAIDKFKKPEKRKINTDGYIGERQEPNYPAPENGNILNTEEKKDTE